MLSIGFGKSKKDEGTCYLFFETKCVRLDHSILFLTGITDFSMQTVNALGQPSIHGPIC